MEDAVVQIFEIIFAKGMISEASVASLLAIGPRTLQRGLKAEGTSFRSVRARFIERKAKSLLSDTDKSVEEIGKALGYSEPKASGEYSRAGPGSRRATFDPNESDSELAALTINSAVLNDRFGKTMLHRRAPFTNLVDVRRHTSLHQHQAASSRKAVINTECSERLVPVKAVVQNQNFEFPVANGCLTRRTGHQRKTVE